MGDVDARLVELSPIHIDASRHGRMDYRKRVAAG